MMGERKFLYALIPRLWSSDAKYPFRPRVLFVGKGANAVEFAAVFPSTMPSRMALLETLEVPVGETNGTRSD